MSTNFGVLIGSMLSAALLAGCALEVSDPVSYTHSEPTRH